MTEDRDMTEAAWLAKLTKAAMRDDMQEFEQVHNLGGLWTKVWYRPLAGDFMAECKATRPGAKRGQRIEATAEGRAECLEALAAAVAQYLFPMKEASHDHE